MVGEDSLLPMSDSCPYQNLFVYVIEGVVFEEDEAMLGSNFLGNWVEEGMSVLFFSASAADYIKKLLDVRMELKVSDEHHFTYEQWQGSENCPLRVGDFLIVAPWEDSEEEHGAIKIIIDPGVVFGNGLHPTTRDCLKGLSWVWSTCNHDRVIDLGTGTGILSIAAAKLGAADVLAVDLNRLCVRTASRNVALNKIDSVVKVMEGAAEAFVERSADLVMANIHFPVIEELIKKRVFSEGETILVSGLLRSQVNAVLDLISHRNLTLLNKWEEDMTWYTIAARWERRKES